MTNSGDQASRSATIYAGGRIPPTEAVHSDFWLVDAVVGVVLCAELGSAPRAAVVRGDDDLPSQRTSTPTVSASVVAPHEQRHKLPYLASPSLTTRLASTHHFINCGKRTTCWISRGIAIVDCLRHWGFIILVGCCSRRVSYGKKN